MPFWINLLSNEYNWGFLDAKGVHWYVGKTIGEDDYKKIVNK